MVRRFKSGHGTRASIEKMQAATIKKTMLTRNFFHNFVGYECIAKYNFTIPSCLTFVALSQP